MLDLKSIDSAETPAAFQDHLMSLLLPMLDEVGAEDENEQDGKISKTVAKIGSGEQAHGDPGRVDDGHAPDLLAHVLLKVQQDAAADEDDDGEGDAETGSGLSFGD